uniref:beta-ketoacyl-[acyl-carrier-protein] synthase I n=1 Tax=Arcella intermedia TaxID=1963864 RepID=A0A6B2L679_9EUKA
MMNGKSGIDKISFDYKKYALPVGVAAEVKRGENGFKIEDWVPNNLKSQVPLFVSYAISAAKQALDDSGWDGDRNTAGVAIGGGIGSIAEITAGHDILTGPGLKKLSPYFIPKFLINMASGYVSILHGFKGPNHSVSTACATGAHAVGDAASFIQRGLADAMLAGATEASIVPLTVAGFSRAKALCSSFNDDPSGSSRPFDVKRDGFVMGEGAGMLMLEEYESAVKRGARIYGEVRGYGLAGEAYHITQPTPDGDAAKRCMEQAIWSSGLDVDDIEYINAHATSTPIGDLSEVKAIKSLFKPTTPLVISSTKGATGHLLGAAGAVEAIYTLMALNTGVLPGNMNLEQLDPQIGELCSPEWKICREPIKREIRAAISNSFGFGGTYASLVFSKLDSN